MKKIKLAILGAGKWQLPICLKAKDMGLETHCFSWEQGAVAKEVVDYFYPISLTEKELILEKCREIGVDGVVTCASDFATEVSCWVAERLGLNTNPYQTVVNIHDKAWVRDKTKNIMSISHPKSFSGSLDALSLSFFPCVVKPVHGSGKRGVWYLDSVGQLEHIKEQVEYNKDENAIVEQFIIGKEYSVETLTYHGKHYVVQITDKVSDGAPHFVELAHHQPADISEECRQKLSDAVCDILSAVGYLNGPSHIELKVTSEGKIYLIDLNPRGGGDYISTELVPLSTNCDFNREVINIALDKYDVSTYPYKNIACSGVYFLTKQTSQWLPYFEKNISCVIRKEYNKDLFESKSNNDRSGFLIYQDKERLDF